ncbi:accessory factor UbiK family protein [Endozoicomonas elysicola]|uniref:accessory factor UbiK family protein n=1 Tax=Endozoicomonas elysicola TaxID=305900 RepID=UPI000364D970|nr:accessory factor UbiK family protein [Endozoicomonas elysicola]
MIDKAALINNIAAKAGEFFNGDKSQTREDIEKNIKALVGSALSKLELVTRDEFDTQVAVLRHTRERLEALEKEMKKLKSKDEEQEDKEREENHKEDEENSAN